MDLSQWLFWNVDTQVDFVYPNGKLYVKDAEKLRPQWKKITRLAKEKYVRVVNTCDSHNSNSAEIDPSPDFINTFPEHCMTGTRGADFVKETEPEDPVIFDWDKEYLITPELFDYSKYRNYVIRKDAFDVFAANPYTDIILSWLKPENVIVYGVTTNICVDFSVKGLLKRVKNVYVVEDAIKELPNIPLPIDDWISKGVNMIRLTDLGKMMNRE
ncbi:MAG: cysteine hydrolase [Prolixibacteraceae bacterium]|jgi:nicotinamidase/pyrazinamidase|nr:cysteine hydrolase [Prolixibacteraceae bacterium]MDD4755931.1 cysteine hydrolase [Prolixibacteraceae bacterium]NLO04141.1 cysteine hydrolase [Bacteroidales bacterium]